MSSVSWFLKTAIAYTSLSEQSLRSIPEAGKDFDIHHGALLAPILQPRVPGTPGSTAVLTHFVNFFQQSLPAWNLTFQNSTSTTPTSNGEQIPFVNLIATRDPPWTTPGQVGRLALVAHYDSKLTPHGFIGATDSAAPCAMIMHAARSIDAALTRKWANMQENEDMDDVDEPAGVQVILLDGEEAFLSWTSTDSTYGARYPLDSAECMSVLTRVQVPCRRMGANHESSHLNLSLTSPLDRPVSIAGSPWRRET